MIQSAAAHVLKNFGEEVTFRGKTVSVVVNKNASPKAWRAGDMPNFSQTNFAEIDIHSAHISSAPEVGEYFDGEGHQRHRIQRVTKLGSVYRCACRTSQQ